MERNCDQCGTAYEAKRPTSKYCTTRCRNRASRTNPRSVTATETPSPRGRIGEVTARDLEAAGLLDTPAGLTAVSLAARLDAAADTGSAMASLSRELTRILDELLAGRGAAVDPVDELKARREQRRRAS